MLCCTFSSMDCTCTLRVNTLLAERRWFVNWNWRRPTASSISRWIIYLSLSRVLQRFLSRRRHVSDRQRTAQSQTLKSKQVLLQTTLLWCWFVNVREACWAAFLVCPIVPGSLSCYHPDNIRLSDVQLVTFYVSFIVRVIRLMSVVPVSGLSCPGSSSILFIKGFLWNPPASPSPASGSYEGQMHQNPKPPWTLPISTHKMYPSGATDPNKQREPPSLLH